MGFADKINAARRPARHEGQGNGIKALGDQVLFGELDKKLAPNLQVPTTDTQLGGRI